MLEVGDTFVPCVSTTAVVRIVADYLSAVLPDLLAEAEARGARAPRPGPHARGVSTRPTP